MAIIIVIIILIWVNIRKKGKSNTSTLFRIMTNYSQIVSASLSMNFTLPSTVSDAFSPLKQTTDSTETFLSIDCFLQDSNLTVFNSSTFILKVLISSLCPFVMIIFVILFWLIV